VRPSAVATLEAMELYVATMEEENPDWWELVTDNGGRGLSLAYTIVRLISAVLNLY
jgi:hypothetical protein